VAVMLKPGTRLRSVTCEAEIVVVKAPAGDLDLRCGGHAMMPVGEDLPNGLAAEAGHCSGVLLGKRYADESSGIEVLCTKGGSSSLSIGEVPLELKDAKPLPSSD
jgi:hypothetical protein